MTRDQLRALCREMAAKGQELAALEQQVADGAVAGGLTLRPEDSWFVDPDITESLANLEVNLRTVTELLVLHIKGTSAAVLHSRDRQAVLDRVDGAPSMNPRINAVAQLVALAGVLLLAEVLYPGLVLHLLRSVRL